MTTRNHAHATARRAALMLATAIMSAGAARAQNGAAPLTPAQFQSLSDRVDRLEARADVENLFSRYMYLHSAFQDRLIPALWVSRGTPGIHA